MRVVEVNPEEIRSRGGRWSLIEPAQGGSDDLFCWPLGFETIRGLGVAVNPIVISIEPLAETKPPVEDERADECAGVVACLAETNRQTGYVGRKHVAVFADAVRRGQQPAHQRDMRGQRERDRGPRGTEAHTVLGQPEQGWCQLLLKPVRAHRIDCDQHDGGRLGRARRVRGILETATIPPLPRQRRSARGRRAAARATSEFYDDDSRFSASLSLTATDLSSIIAARHSETPCFMSDPLRTDPSINAPDSSGAERDARVEELLLDGLDHYFAARYEQAIHVWTRVMFLDRGHARAKAYIERARSAVAERQRESEELLYRGVHAFNRGDTDVARDLLTSAIDRGGPNEVALALLARLTRLQTAGGVEAVPPDAAPAARRREAGPPLQAVPRSRMARILGTAAIILIVALVATLVVGPEELARRAGIEKCPAGAPPQGSWPQHRARPSRCHAESEALLERGRVLAAAGHLNEALQALDRIRLGDPLRGEADRLRADVQKQLLALAEIDLRPAVIPERKPRRDLAPRMKCPKCGYLGFETGDRCRNCGYDFSFSVEPPDAPDLSLRTNSEPLGPLTDLKLFPSRCAAARGTAPVGWPRSGSPSGRQSWADNRVAAVQRCRGR